MKESGMGRAVRWTPSQPRWIHEALKARRPLGSPCTLAIVLSGGLFPSREKPSTGPAAARRDQPPRWGRRLEKVTGHPCHPRHSGSPHPAPGGVPETSPLHLTFPGPALSPPHPQLADGPSAGITCSFICWPPSLTTSLSFMLWVNDHCPVSESTCLSG